MTSLDASEGSQSLMSVSLSTWDLLLSLGFKGDPRIVSDVPVSLSRDFGSFSLKASYGLNRWFQRVVLLSGVLATPRTVTHLECEMPVEVGSWEQGVAWVVWCLDKHTGGIFVPPTSIPWLADGRRHRDLLPWEKEMAEYARRPYCRVERDWARIALKKLAEQLVVAPGDIVVTFRFDGEVLSIRCGDSLLTMSATGAPWESVYAVRAKDFGRLPKRLMREQVSFSVWETSFYIDNWRYDLAVGHCAE